MTAARDVTIVGAGPAGIAAAVYLKRVGVNPLLIERNKVGGLLRNANLVENYPGFPEGISGGDLVRLLEAQLKRWRIRVTRADVKKVAWRKDHYLLETTGGKITSRFVVVATGTRPRRIGLPGLDKVPSQKVHYEVADILRKSRGKRFLVIGGGDAAFDYSLNLASKGCHTDIVFKSRKPRCIPLLLERARKERKVRLFPGSKPESVDGSGGTIVLRCKGESGRFELESDAMLIACGRDPELGILPESQEWREGPAVNAAEMRGLFIVGDVRRGMHRQVGIAVGDGIHAAMEIASSLREESDEDSG